MYRLEQEFNRQGLKLSRQTMANWLLKASGEMAAVGLRCMSKGFAGGSAARGRKAKVSGIPQTAGEHPCGGLLGACAVKI